MKNYRFIWRALIAVLFITPVAQAEETDPETIAARDAIWAKEKAIYAARGDGNLQVYADSISDAYVGWPPGLEEPGDSSYLRNAAANMATMENVDNEELTMKLTGFTRSGDTAVIYYSTHRTVLPTGEPVDQRFHIIHVWTLEEGDWRLVGALGRMLAETDG